MNTTDGLRFRVVLSFLEAGGVVLQMLFMDSKELAYLNHHLCKQNLFLLEPLWQFYNDKTTQLALAN